MLAAQWNATMAQAECIAPEALGSSRVLSDRGTSQCQIRDYAAEAVGRSG
ncbi:MAG TPA: hypothetical protein VKG65_00875 [Terriglobales bacterium]|nr:hypothetical protein [Terriglobales bacterium]